MVRTILQEGDNPSPEALARLAALDGRPVDTSDISEATDEELKEIARQVREKRRKKMFSLRLSNETIEWWQQLGEGYTGIMARLLEKAKSHPEWIKQCL
ncbi:BrnA antitoxin family protein [Leadbettera azotonutricia]|nr:BrnA antitoxin family protein [Leadbettera azotonutricia]